jgi:hypothetical protein
MATNGWSSCKSDFGDRGNFSTLQGMIGRWLTPFARFVVAGFAVIALAAAQLMLSAAIHGMNCSGGDAWSRLGLASTFQLSSLPGIRRSNRLQCS